jgi:3-methyladenine DNA glycosylase AlkD
MEKYLEKLMELSDEKNAKFIARLVPNIDSSTIIGMRSPQIKNLVKELKNDPNKEIFLKELPHKYYEENVLHASIISTISKDINTTFEYIDAFLPYVDNWSVCDSMVSSLKIFKKHTNIVKEKVNDYLKSDKTYTIRFALVTHLAYFLDDNFNKEIIDILIKIESDEYYVNMALAWYYSFGLIKQYDAFIGLLEQKSLPKFVQNKAIQKARESFRISKETKEYLKTLKI